MKTERELRVGSDAGRSTTLWHVDDSKVYRDLLAEQFQREWDIHWARQFSSAESAIAALAYGPPPDVILLDVQMGGICGIDAIRPMKAIAPSTRIIILTSFHDFEVQKAAFVAGADGFLSKMNPFDQILDWIRNPGAARLQFDPGPRTASAPARTTQPRIESGERDGVAQAPSLLRFFQPAPKG
jgi:DNA-binding NarL/FixJ family response regulator